MPRPSVRSVPSPNFVWAQTQVLQVGKSPQGVAAVTAGSNVRLFVANQWDGTISVFDATTLQPIGQPIAVSRNNGLSGIATSPGSASASTPVYLFVPTSGTVDHPDDEVLTVIDARSLRIVSQSTPIGSPVYSAAVAPDNSYVFITCEDGHVSVVDAKTFATAGSPIPAGTQPFSVAITPDSARAYVVNLDEPGSVTVIDAQALTVITTLTGFFTPVSAAASVDNVRVFVGNMAGGDGPVLWIDNRNTPPTLVPTPVIGAMQPDAMAVSPDGNFLFIVVPYQNQVLVIDPTTLETFGQAIPVGVNPQAVAVSPDSQRVFVANQSDNTVSVIERVPIQTEPLLKYAPVCVPDPLTASFPAASVGIVVNNGGSSTVINCTQIVIAFSVGDNSGDLTTDPTTIQTQMPTGWNVARSGGVFTLTPQTPADGEIAGQGLEFLFTNVAVNAQPAAQCPITIYETASGYPQPSMMRSEVINLVKANAGFTLSDLTADPLEVPSGGTTTLQWTGSASTSTMPVTYTMIYDTGTESVSDPVGNTGPYTSKPLTQTPSVTFTLEAMVTLSGQDEPIIVQEQVSVTVDAA